MSVTMAVLVGGACGLAAALIVLLLAGPPLVAVAYAGGSFIAVAGLGLTIQGQLHRV
ncbi:hypothetical protein [Streptomyces sp. CA-251247]|uniref:hypothetical protein n=1 Tax=Streptomyces sp. CA-251247 TaxID=3240062 RepID=UPI003D91A2D9